MSQAESPFEVTVLSKLIDVGIALSATSHLKDLLRRITTEARLLTRSDAGSLYIREGNDLRFVISQNDKLDNKNQQASSNNTDETENSVEAFRETTMPISEKSIAGFVALNKEIHIIDDAYDLPADSPYSFNKSFDEQNGYRTHSILVSPMLDTEGEVIGVLQLINHLDDKGNTVPYSKGMIPLVQALASQAGVAVKNAQLAQELKDTHYDTILRLSTAAELRDNETGNHVKRVSGFCHLIAQQMDLPYEEAEMIMAASPMHDVGKIGIPDRILRKPGRFDKDERTIMETHADLGGDIMKDSDSPLIQMCESIARTHHERWDGKGYPEGLTGEEVGLPGRILVLAEVYAALVEERSYKQAWPIEKIVGFFRAEAGGHFDPDLANIVADGLEVNGKRFFVENADSLFSPS